MVGTVDLVGGQKELVATSGGSGNPLGTYLLVHGNTVPAGYLPMETPFDENQYPALFAMLGTNVTPDVPADLGADWNNKQAIPISQNISYTATESGWIFGSIELEGSAGGWAYLNGAIIGGGYAESGHSEDAICLQFRIDKGDVFTTVINATVSTSRSDLYFVPFKKFAHVVIKATSGLDETQQDYVLQSLNEAGSYSTEEVATGKRWIDGKPIYKKTFVGVFSSGVTLVSDADTLINQYGSLIVYSNVWGPFPRNTESSFAIAELNENSHIIVTDFSTTWTCKFTVEYTKATPST